MDLELLWLKDRSFERTSQISGRWQFRGKGWGGSGRKNLGKSTRQPVERLGEFLFLLIGEVTRFSLKIP
jgi:hypothetical protein